LFPVKNISGVAKKDRHPLNINGALSDKIVNLCYPLKKLRRAEGGAKNFGVFRVKNHDFTPKNHIFSILGDKCYEMHAHRGKNLQRLAGADSGGAPGAPP
jgi:hypothetical protein